MAANSKKNAGLVGSKQLALHMQENICEISTRI
jgi:hypothetical protein